jgi:hypothetical protein
MATLTTAANWYAHEFEFRQLCSDALSQAKGERAEEFTHDMMKKANTYGLSTNVSEAQLRWLCQLADHEVPQRRIP